MKYIWKELDSNKQRELIEQYTDIKKQIKRINSKKANTEKTHKYTPDEEQRYRNQITELQNKYSDIKIYYKCDFCEKVFELPFDKIKRLFKGDTKPIFCNVKCSGKYYANKSHDKSREEQEKVNAKISGTLLEYNKNLTVRERIERYGKGITKYWQEKTTEEKSKMLKDRVPSIKKSKLDKYGNENYNNRTLAMKTYTEKYGVDNPLKLEENRNKAKQVIKEKYGVDNFFENKDLFKERSLERYGVEHPMQNKDVKQKLGNTKFLRYGDENYNNPLKFNKTFLERYGVKRPFQLKKYVYKSEQTKLRRYKDPHYNNREKALKTLYERYGENYYENQLSNVGNRISKINLKFGEYMGITNFEFPLDTYSYDLRKDNILIEINPTFTHNSLPDKIYGRFGGLDKLYHYNKTKMARDNGYECINIFDWDDWEKIQYLLQDKKTLYARKLELKEVSSKDIDVFLNKYHIQGTCRSQIIRLGLYDEKELIEVMTFGIPRYNKNYEYELLRLCTMGEYKVVGGAERLFKYFIQKYNPNSIISYCDYSKFSGEVYSRLGFIQKGKPTPSLHWSINDTHITNNLLNQRGFDQLFKTNYGKGTSNEKLMLQHGWLPIYDCGQLTFIWKPDSV